ncbi:hypothetical protein DCO56_08875 [Sphingobacterium athyrii]|uniref:HAD family phosphatase n=1 Tax=Sphingobacterium athyrii TaxID=2152717 RepID=A0A363NW72_9SPHI|nr:hypothetical protein DCO56_08875 [Sphingobacterium athyrii]
MNTLVILAYTIKSPCLSKGKSSSDIYIKTALELNLMPSKYIIFEDSISGIRAAFAADMSVMAVPESESLMTKDPK